MKSKKMTRYALQTKNSEIYIDIFDDENVAYKALAYIESDDKKNGMFIPGYYEVIPVEEESYEKLKCKLDNFDTYFRK